MGKNKKFSLGLDFGTESARVALIDVATGELAASAVCHYPDGVIDRILPIKSKVKLEPEWSLQNPADYLETIKKTVPLALKQAKIKAEDVIGIGIGFTSCTVLPTSLDGVPLCSIPAYRDQPHSWVKLWKHHSAQPEAEQINAVASERNEPFLKRYGGKVSSEWFFPKILEIVHDAPEIIDAAGQMLEAQDWVVWQLTGNQSRSSCAAGYKALWSKKDHFPPPGFLEALHPGMKEIVSKKIGSAFFPPGTRAGNLTPYWSSVTKLNSGTPVGVPIIDAHSSVLGCGVTQPNEMVLCMGTSLCHLVLGDEEQRVEGISGVVEDGIVPGYFAYEAGQAAVGDLFAWYVKNGSPSWRPEKIKKNGPDLFRSLEKKAAPLHPGESGLLALDWWNGNRSILVDANCSGLLIGCTLNTQPHEVYRALMESTAMGTLKIIQAFEEKNIAVKKLHVTGGLAERSPLLMQIFADVTGRELVLTETPQICALGAAILGAVAAGKERGGYSSISDAVQNMARAGRKQVQPDRGNHKIYSQLYQEYCRLHDYFGRGQNRVMEKLRDLKRQAISGLFL